MSYNIDTWKVKKLENLTIPLKSLYVSSRSDWHPDQPEINDPETMKIKIEGGSEGFIIEGFLNNGVITVTKIELYGERSGSFKHYVLDNALKDSSGELEVVLVWEGGDLITKLKVKDGIIEENDIEL